MEYTVVIEKPFKARQGLVAPVRHALGLPPAMPAEGFQSVLRIGIVFGEEQLTDRGWFVDTDAVERVVADMCNQLESDVWTNLFKFRPTYELVARWIFERLAGDVSQLAFVELENQTMGVTTRYQKS